MPLLNPAHHLKVLQSPVSTSLKTCRRLSIFHLQKPYSSPLQSKGLASLQGNGLARIYQSIAAHLLSYKILGKFVEHFKDWNDYGLTATQRLKFGIKIRYVVPWKGSLNQGTVDLDTSCNPEAVSKAIVISSFLVSTVGDYGGNNGKDDPALALRETSWINMAESWQTRQSVQKSTIHAEKMASSLVSACSGFSLSELMMHPLEPSAREVLPCSSWQETVTSPEDIRPVNFFYPSVNMDEKLFSHPDVKTQFNGVNSFSSFSKSSCLDSEKLQASFQYPTCKSKTIQQSGFNYGQPGFLPYLEAENNCIYSSTVSTAALPISLDQTQSLASSSQLDFFSNPQVISEQINHALDGQMISHSLYEPMIYSHCNNMPPANAISTRQLYWAEPGSLMQTNPTTSRGICGSFDRASGFSTTDIAGDHMHVTDDLKTQDALWSQTPNNPSNSHTVVWQTLSGMSQTNSSAEVQCIDNSIGHDDPRQLRVPHNSLKRTYTDVKEERQSMKKSTSWSSLNSYDTGLQKSPKLKSRTKQGSACDPQSVAARHRRERISERLKILQDLVPNGSKVDLVTMLEKAINYVKFLQLQVRVLATDEYWPTKDNSGPNILEVQNALQAIASRSSAETEGTSSTNDVKEKKDENIDSP
eukprot:Gb_30839 [translate_table: standard]